MVFGCIKRTGHAILTKPRNNGVLPYCHYSTYTWMMSLSTMMGDMRLYVFAIILYLIFDRASSKKLACSPISSSYWFDLCQTTSHWPFLALERIFICLECCFVNVGIEVDHKKWTCRNPRFTIHGHIYATRRVNFMKIMGIEASILKSCVHPIWSLF
jgi:hypothetical protein